MRSGFFVGMPRAPLVPCRQPGCAELVDEGYCHQHQVERNRQYNAARRSDPSRNDAFYSSRAWRRRRAQHLREEPLCRECIKLGIIVAASEVDHIVPIERGGAWFADENLQSLCKPCHSSKSATEGSRWGRGASNP